LKKKKSRGGKGITKLGREIIQRGANFLPLFLLKETEAFVPHDREARTREEKGDWAEKKRTKNTEEPREINPETTTTLYSFADGLIPSVTAMNFVGKNNTDGVTDGVTDGSRPSV